MVGDFFGIDPRAASHAIGRGELRIDSEASARSKSRSLRVPNTNVQDRCRGKKQSPWTQCYLCEGKSWRKGAANWIYSVSPPPCLRQGNFFHFIQHDIERAEGIALRTPASMDGRDDMKTPTTGSGSKLDPTRKKPKTRRKGEQAS